MPECATDLASIAEECGGYNAPGLKQKVYIIETANVSSIPAAVDHEVADLTLEASKFWAEFNIDVQDQQLTSEPSSDDENAAINNTLQFFIPRLSAAKSKILNSCIGAKFLAVATDKKGKVVLLGDLDDGCTFQARKSATEKNGYLVTMRQTSSHLPYFYTGTTPLS